MTRIDIGITTFKRPCMLEDTLRAVEKLYQLDEWRIRVEVADNDSSDGEGLALVKRLSEEGYQFRLDGQIVSGRGFTYPRNALIHRSLVEGDADLLIIIDDDQIPEPAYLLELVAMWQSTFADIVAPVVVPIFEGRPAPWITSSRLYERESKAQGIVAQLTGDGGILIGRSAANLLPPPWYDHDLALTGGADKDVFLRLRGAGATFARAPLARIGERYPASRLTRRWALQRAYRLGNCEVLIMRKSKSRLTLAIKEGPKIAGALVLCSLGAIVYPAFPGFGMRMAHKFARAIGKITAFAGHAYEEYAVTHGA